LRTAALLYDRTTAMIAAAFVMVMPLMSVGAINISPDVPSVLFYVLGVWALAELDRSQDGRWWLILGVCAGLGLLSKYTNLFLGAAILVWLAAIPGNRRWFGSPYLWLGGAIAAIIATPVVVWNAKHDWASFAFQFGRVVRASPKHTFHGLEMLGTFVALASPVIAFLSLYGLVVVMRRALATRTAGDVILSGATAPLLIYFCVHVLHNQVNGNWLAPIYPFLAICAARALEASRLTAWRTPLLHGGLAIGVLFSAVIYQHALTPLTGSRADPLEQLRGWDEFSQAIDQIRQRHGAAWIATGDFCTNAQLAFALKNGVATAQVNERIRYVDGPSLSPQMRDETAIYVEPAKGADESVVQGAFDHVVALEDVTRATGKPGGTRYNVYLVTGLGPTAGN
jgi:4-amino-4-deoxy-L-arabinose transferase-like glycosyltransferase